MVSSLKYKRDQNGKFIKGNIPYTKIFGHSKETRLKMSKAQTGKISPKKGKTYHPLSKEHKIKISEGMKRSLLKIGFQKGHVPWHKGKKLPQISGKNNPHWKGGISNSVFYNRLAHTKRRSLMKEAGILTIKNIRKIYKDNILKFGTLYCEYHDEPISFKESSIDHKIPLVRGGSNQNTNLLICCRKCNSKKHTRTDVEFISIITQKYLYELEKEGRIKRSKINGEDVWQVV